MQALVLELETEYPEMYPITLGSMLIGGILKQIRVPYKYGLLTKQFLASLSFSYRSKVQSEQFTERLIDELEKVTFSSTPLSYKIETLDHLLTYLQSFSHVFVSLNSENARYFVEICKLIKRYFPSIQLCTGGIYPSYFISTEEEKIFDHVFKGPDILQIKNLFREATVNVNPVPQVDQFKQDVQLVDLSYVQAWFPLFVGLGCKWQCNFCFTPFFRGQEYLLSPPELAKRTKNCVKQGITKLLYSTNTFNISDQYVEQVARELLEQNMTTQYKIATTFRARIMSEKTLQLFKAAGGDNIFIGIESWSDSLRQKMNKFFRNEDAQLLLERLIALDYEVICGLIVGFPGETEEDIELTRQFIRQFRNYPKLTFSIQVLTIDTYHPIYKDLLIAGKMTPDQTGHGWTLGNNDYQSRLQVQKQLEQLAVK